MEWLIAALALAGVYLLLEIKTSRPDGRLIPVHPYRRLMAFIMPTRTESAVYYDSYIDATRLLEFVERYRDHPVPAGMTHILVAATNIALAENPSMNRFVMGGRMYQRDGRWLTFSMKRKKLDRAAKLAVVKLRMDDRESFEGLCQRVQDKIGENRSGRKTYADKEYSLFNTLPRFVLRLAVPLVRALDDRNLLPGFFIDGDGMYTSVFIANLGSLGMDTAFHHLYEWGTCPLFMMVGRVQPRPVVVDGELAVRETLHIRWTYDERIDDGLSCAHGMRALARVLEDPERYLGAHPMLAHLQGADGG